MIFQNQYNRFNTREIKTLKNKAHTYITESNLNSKMRFKRFASCNSAYQIAKNQYKEAEKNPRKRSGSDGDQQYLFSLS